MTDVGPSWGRQTTAPDGFSQSTGVCSFPGQSVLLTRRPWSNGCQIRSTTSEPYSTGSGPRQNDHESSAARSVGLVIGVTAEGLGQLADRGQSQAGAAGGPGRTATLLGEALEQAGDEVLGHPWSVVRHLDGDRVLRRRSRRTRYPGPAHSPGQFASRPLYLASTRLGRPGQPGRATLPARTGRGELDARRGDL